LLLLHLLFVGKYLIVFISFYLIVLSFSFLAIDDSVSNIAFELILKFLLDPQFS